MEEAALKFLLENSEWIKSADIVSWLFSYVKWGFTKALYHLCQGSEKVLDKAFTIFGFLEYELVANIYSKFQQLTLVIAAICLAVIGFKMMANIKIPIKNVFLRLVLFSVLIVQMPSIMTTINGYAKNMYKASNSLASTVTDGTKSTTGNSMAFTIFENNVVDLKYVSGSEGGFSNLAEGKKKNNFKESNFLNTDFSDIITPEDAKKLKQKEGAAEETEYLKYKITNDEKGEAGVTEIKNGWLSIFNEGTFRYQGKHGLMNVSFITLFVFNLMVAVKLIFLVLELVYQKISFPVLAAADLETGQRTKKAVEGIFLTFLTVGMLGVSKALFVLYYAFLGTLRFNTLGFAIAAWVGVLAFLRGSDKMAQQLGVDLSMKEGMSTLGTMAAGAFVASKLPAVGGAAADGAKNAAESVKQSATSGLGKARNASMGSMQKIGEELGELSEGGLGAYMGNKMKTAVGAAGAKAEGVGEKAKSLADPVKQFGSDLSENTQEGLAKGISKAADARAAKGKETLAEPEVPNTKAPTKPVNQIDPSIPTEANLSGMKQPLREGATIRPPAGGSVGPGDPSGSGSSGTTSSEGGNNLGVEVKRFSTRTGGNASAPANPQPNLSTVKAESESIVEGTHTVNYKMDTAVKNNTAPTPTTPTPSGTISDQVIAGSSSEVTIKNTQQVKQEVKQINESDSAFTMDYSTLFDEKK